MELGSFSDWVSSLSTFGTLIVACMAYKKAPEWIDRRKHENAYDRAIHLIAKELPDINVKIINFYCFFYYFPDSISDADLTKWLDVLCSPDRNKEFHNIKETMNKLDDNISYLSRLGWNLKQTHSGNYKNIKKNYCLSMVYTCLL